MNDLNIDQAISMRNALEQILSESATVIDAIESTPLPHSSADIELKNFQRPLSIKTAHDQAYLLIESSADYLSCLIRSITEPVQTIAPWSLTRSVLESAAVSIWIGSPKISALERVQRSLAFRFKGIQQQAKLAMNDTRINMPLNETFDRLVNIANEIGAVVKLSKNGIPKRIGAHFPSFTDLCTSELGEAATYRILSAMTHSQPFAIQQLSFKVLGPANNDAERFDAEKHISNLSIGWLCERAACAFLRALCARLKLFGYLTGEVIAMLRKHAAELKLVEDQFRFCIWLE